MKSHAKEITYQCTMCGSGFKCNNHLKRHIKSYAVESQYHSALCGNCFIFCHNINRYMKSHAGDNPCALCGKKFKLKKAIKKTY